LPELTQIIKGGQTITQIAMSPDRTKMAYLFNDPANPPNGYKLASSFGVTTNALALFDMTTAKPIFIAQAGKGEGFEAITWTQDSQKVLVTAGNYKDTNYLVMPHVVTVNVVEIA